MNANLIEFFLSPIATTAIKVLLVFGVLMLGIMYTTLAERKLSAYIQGRIGPNRAGPYGLLQPIADGIKFLFKEDVIPLHVDLGLYLLAPILALTPALMLIAIIPFGNEIIIGGTRIPLQILDIDIGILYLFAIASIGVYGVIFGGWASNNKFSLLGGIRASSQIISYEVSFFLAVVGILMVYQTLRLSEIVHLQDTILKWGIFRQPFGFVIFLIATFAETARIPFDLPEAEAELVAGYHTEYGSIKFGSFQLGEFAHMITSSAVMTTLFFGGWQIPGLAVSESPSIFLSLAWVGSFLVKTSAIVFFFILVRWTLPRLRFDQLMRFGWKVLLPAALINIFITGLVILIV
jgi:NADH-quinone oxidoreductase subunit H